MGLTVWIIGIVVGVVALGWVYHRYTTQTTNAIDAAANVVNQAIDDVKKKI